MEDVNSKASNDGLLALNTLAEYLACSRTYAAKLVSDGTSPSFKLGSLRRIRKADLDAYIESRLAKKD